MLKCCHNSIHNPKYPIKTNTLNTSKYQFTIIGNYLSKEFIECCEIANLLYQYKKKKFDLPIIQGTTAIDWPSTWNDLKIRFGEKAFCMKSAVAVLLNGIFLGGVDELKQMLKDKYTFNINIDYYNQIIQAFVNRVRSSGVYVDILPVTSENFLRLCTLKRGGYKGTPIHRIVKDGWIQCGGYGLKGITMSCENYVIPHDARGILCMANEDRNIDNSTQFFVLLQPAAWMDQKYVAFGKLIEGEETLVAIENVPTYYQSPTKNLVIMDSGILNVECQDLTPNLGVNEYIESHIEDLVELGCFLIDMLMDNVYFEAKFREVSKLQQPVAEDPEEENKVHATKRFNKEDIQKHFGHADETALRDGTVEPDTEAYEPEEYVYQQVSPTPTSKEIKETHPYYLELTDVPYPGEVDSVFDFKRYLKGYYCLETDLESKQEIKEKQKPKPKTVEPLDVNEFNNDNNVIEDTSKVESWNLNEEEHIREYLRLNADKASFAGEIISKIAKGANLKALETIQTPPLSNIVLKKATTYDKTLATTASRETSTGIDSLDNVIDRRNKEVRISSAGPRRKVTQNHGRNEGSNVGTILKFSNGTALKNNNVLTENVKENFLTHTSIPSYIAISSDENVMPEKAIDKSFNMKMALQHGFESRISTDYINTLKLGHPYPKYSIRSIEYAKTRPSISVQKYKMKHRETQ